MNSAYVLYHMVRADFLERVRRYSFLVTLASVLYLAYAVAAEKLWIVVGNGYRGVYNSAWVGTLMTVSCSIFLSLAGFYIVKNSVQRDTDTRVGQILAATPMRKDFYTIAKTLSNFAVLACMVAILMLAALIMQLMRGEAHSLSLWKLWSPFLFLALPAMLLTASLAVLFETIPGLRVGFGNVAYFFLWTAALSSGATGFDDPSGLQLLYRSARNALQKIDPSNSQNFHFSLTIGGERAARTFLWNGIDWTAGVLAMRLAWIALAFVFAFVASIFFRRFDPAYSWRKKSKAADTAAEQAFHDWSNHSPIPISVAHLAPLASGSRKFRFMQLVTSELKLMLKGRRWWWYVGAGGMLIGELVAGDPNTRGGFLLAAWLWPIFIWSEMGCRESRFATSSLIFSSERSLSRQFPALLSAGVLVAVLTGVGVGVRLLIAGDWHTFAAWLAGVFFIPSLALALGVWTGASKTFEAIYVAWWYLGPAHQIPGFDFMGTTPLSSTPLRYALGAAFLLAVAYWRRRTRLGYV
jgi:hypothetical protein